MLWSEELGYKIEAIQCWLQIGVMKITFFVRNTSRSVRLNDFKDVVFCTKGGSWFSEHCPQQGALEQGKP